MDSFVGSIGLVGVVVVVAGLLQCAAAATTHVVGGSSGWTFPSSAQLYTNWASGKTFMVGDTLSFVFNAQAHDVAEVTKAEHDACTSTNPIGTIIRSSPANVLLNSTGNHHFICSFPGHCSAGQKLTINVVPSSTTTAPSSPPTVSPSPSPASTVPPSVPSPAPTVSMPSPSPAPMVSPSPSPSPMASPGPSPSPMSSSSPSPSPMGSSSPSPTVPSDTSPPPTVPTSPTGPSSPPPVPTDGSVPPPTEGPPAPSFALPLSTGHRSMAFSVAILMTFFL